MFVEETVTGKLTFSVRHCIFLVDNYCPSFSCWLG